MPSPDAVSSPPVRAKTVVIVACGLLFATAAGSSSLGLVFYMRELYGVSAGTVGLLAGIYCLTYVAGCVLLRPALRRIRSRHCLLIATGGAAAMTLGILLARSVVATFLLYAILGFQMAFFWPPLASWLSHGLESRALARATSLFNMSWSIGSIVSSIVGGSLSELHPSSPLWLSVALFGSTFVLLVLLALLVPWVRRDDHRDAGTARTGEPDQSTPARFPAWIGVFAAWTVIGVLLNVFPLHALEVLGMSKSGIGILLLMRAAATTLAFLALGRLSFWHFRVRVMVAGQTLCAALLAILALARSAAAIGLLLVGIGLCCALAYSSSIFHGLAGSTERGRRMGIHEAVLSVGLVLGSAAGGFVYEHLSMTVVFLGSAVLLATTAVAQVAVAALASRGRAPAREPATRA